MRRATKGPATPGTEPFMVGPPEDRARPWRVVVGRERTGGAFALGDARIPPGSPGPGRHVHTHEDEAIYVIAGILTVEVGDQRFHAGPQSLVWMPRGIPHVFANLSNEVVWTVGTTTPPGLEDMFREQAEYFRTLQDLPPDPEALMRLSARYGVFPVDGPPLQAEFR